MSITARKAAFDTLSAITKEGAYTTLAIKKHIPDTLSLEDKRFASLLVRTTLENLLRIDYALDQFITAKRVHGSVRNVLRLGACQILFVDVADYAAVSESVKLIKKIKPQMSGFVNGVLRSLVKGATNIVYPNGNDAHSLSIAYSYPLWICKKFITDFGFEFTKSLLSYKADPSISVRMNRLKTDACTFEQHLDQLKLDYSKGNAPHSYHVSGLSGIEQLDIFKDGHIAIQSQSAMQAVIETDIKKDDELLDCCAAPGGKSAYAQALSGNTLGIVAWDIHQHRVDMTNKNYHRLGVHGAKAVLHDASVYEPCLAGRFDVVMVDAPCSAMGLMTRNADIRYNRSAEDIKALSEKQRKILRTCAKYVKSGGTLAYFTCSINKEENEQVTDWLIRENKEFAYKQEPITLYPHISRSDGFYIAVMKRKI